MWFRVCLFDPPTQSCLYRGVRKSALVGSLSIEPSLNPHLVPLERESRAPGWGELSLFAERHTLNSVKRSQTPRPSSKSSSYSLPGSPTGLARTSLIHHRSPCPFPAPFCPCPARSLSPSHAPLTSSAATDTAAAVTLVAVAIMAAAPAATGGWRRVGGGNGVGGGLGGDGTRGRRTEAETERAARSARRRQRRQW